MTDIPDHVPLSLSEDAIQPLYARDAESGARVPDDDLDMLADAMRQARGQAEQVLALSRTLREDHTKTRSGVALTLRQNGLRAGEKAAQALDRARDRVAATVARLSAETGAPPMRLEAGMLETETRQALARMGPKERTAAIAEAFEAGDDTVIGAVLRGPALLSGMSTDQQVMARDRYRQERHPQEADRIARLSTALEGLERAAISLVGFTDAVTSAPNAIQAERAAERTEQALAAFT